jgi:hypothetical protein
MPYFVYYVRQEAGKTVKSLEYLDVFENYRDARARARKERAELAEAKKDKDCRMIFAKNQVEAEKLLSAPREERVIGED